MRTHKTNPKRVKKRELKKTNPLKGKNENSKTNPLKGKTNPLKGKKHKSVPIKIGFLFICVFIPFSPLKRDPFLIRDCDEHKSNCQTVFKIPYYFLKNVLKFFI